MMIADHNPKGLKQFDDDIQNVLKGIDRYLSEDYPGRKFLIDELLLISADLKVTIRQSSKAN